MSKIHDGIIGVAIGDALGVPVEFESRSTIAIEPVTAMRAYGTHHQPAGTWSDDIFRAVDTSYTRWKQQYGVFFIRILMSPVC